MGERNPIREEVRQMKAGLRANPNQDVHAFVGESLKRNPKPIMFTSCLGLALMFVVTPGLVGTLIWFGTKRWLALLAGAVYFLIIGNVVIVMRRKAGLPTPTRPSGPTMRP